MEIDEKKVLTGFVVVVSVFMLTFGAIGMTLSFLFLWSSNYIDVMGAGQGFIAGSVMMGSGLISLAVISPKTRDQK